MASELRPVRFGLTTAIMWCACVFFLGIMATYLDWGKMMQSAIRSLYPGYRRNPFGILIGMIWAFIDGFFGGTIFACIYNWLGGCRYCKNPEQSGRKDRYL